MKNTDLYSSYLLEKGVLSKSEKNIGYNPPARMQSDTMDVYYSRKLLIWVFQTGEPLHLDGKNVRPMRAMNIANALVQAGHKVVLWSSAFYHQEKRHRSPTSKRIRISNNLEIRLIPSMGYNGNVSVARLMDHAQLAFNLKNMLGKEKELPHAAFIGYPPVEPAAVMVSWLARRGVPTLLDVKDQWPAMFLDIVPASCRPLVRLVLSPYFYLARGAMRNATGLSTMANGFLDWALKFAGRERTEKDGVFPLTSPSCQVNDEDLKTARQWWDQRGIGKDGRPCICFVGSQSPAFDFKPVYAAARMASNSRTGCEFVICGEGSSSGKVRAMMSSLSNVHFPGWIDRPKAVALAERSYAALAPYLCKENFIMNIPNKIIDALSLGLPVLSPLQGEVAKLITEHGVGMCYGADTGKSLYDCILALMQDAALRKRISLAAHSLYLGRFSFDKVYGSLVKHLEILSCSAIALR
ncbi:putative Glycosyltransferase-like protein [uncultured Desulfobacterium sp.]|uniref:Putative Glycosyltransferase-like protein n=1 Tax=uncultured Desulfobacterium sp. TaxID=201089 RepID=A0A445MYV3_9BACT|nr:putative Glycosyltransferase-like protein [uncultured Desulfobacterium sp.]